MAEFQEVIKHWGRMLDAHRHGESIAIEASVPADAFKNAKLVEEIVMKWAEEHPEPVYPTWYEYLEKVFDPEVTKYPDDAESFFYAACTYRIKADTAEKLGIEPKEEER